MACACDTDLEASYDDFRDQVPPVCKDFCEEKVACERVEGTGIFDDEVFTSQVHLCEVECAAYAIEGVYVWRQDSTGVAARYYEWHVDGGSVLNAFGCLYDMGAYRCVNTGSAYEHELNPAARNVCDAANECVADFLVDHRYYWAASSDGLGGSCNKSGSDFIESIFF